MIQIGWIMLCAHITMRRVPLEPNTKRRAIKAWIQDKDGCCESGAGATKIMAGFVVASEGSPSPIVNTAGKMAAT